MGNFCYSLDGETFQGDYDSEEEAFEVGLAEEDPYYVQPGTEIYVGQAVKLNLEEHKPDVIHLLDGLQEWAYDEVREHSGDWLDHPDKEAIALLEKAVIKLLKSWVDEHEPMRFFSVPNSKPIEVTRDLFLKYHDPDDLIPVGTEAPDGERRG